MVHQYHARMRPFSDAISAKHHLQHVWRVRYIHKHHLRAPRHLCRGLSQEGTQPQKTLCFAGCAVVDRQVVASPDQILSHGTTHGAQPNITNPRRSHRRTPFWLIIASKSVELSKVIFLKMVYLLDLSPHFFLFLGYYSGLTTANYGILVHCNW